MCQGKRGTIHQAYRDGMEDQLGSLGLVLNVVVLWTTRYIDAAVAQLRAEGHEIRDEDIARLSPLKHKNLNVLGRYGFTPSVPARGLRPLRDPDAPGLDDEDDDDGAEDRLEGSPPVELAGSPPVRERRSSQGGQLSRGRRGPAVAAAPAAVALPHTSVAGAIAGGALSIALAALALVPHGETSSRYCLVG